ncbi:MAG: PAS domain S-box protein, partial [Spirochaetes bacterium]|nr:PAS domain S-box protein [Spirochaetota bacterium]
MHLFYLFKHPYTISKYLRYIYLLFIIMGSLIINTTAAHSSHKYKALVIHSYHQGFSWTDNIMAGIQSGFHETDLDVELCVEYMDTKRHQPDKLFTHLEKIYRSKYHDQQFDVIIVSDDNALNFLLKRRDKLFPGVPIVFCCINNFEDSRIAGHDQITGIAEDFDLSGTLELALRLHPMAKHVAVVNDTTPTGMANLKRLRLIIPKFKNTVEFIELFNLNVHELKKNLCGLPDNTIILLLSFYRDRDGRMFSYEEYTALVTRHCNLPVYSAWDFFLGHGVVGGVMTSGQLQGENAARKAIRILKGESADSIPILRESPNSPMFDYNQLKHFGISLSDIPKESIILNEPKTFYHQYKRLIWITITFILLQIIVIIVLLLNIIRRKWAEESLRESEKRYRELANSLPEIVFEMNEKGIITFVNHIAFDLFGYTQQEFEKGLNAFRMIISQDVDRVKKNIERIFNGEQIGGIEYTAKRKDGREFPVIASATPVNHNNKNIGVRGIIVDITDRKIAEEALLAEKERLAVTLRSISDGMIATDIMGNVVLINKAAETLTGWELQEAVGKPLNKIFCIINEKTRKPCKSPVEKVIKQGIVANLANNTLLIAKDGTERIIADGAAPIRDKESKIIGVVFVFSDVTEKRKMEDELQKAQKLESLGLLAGGIAHDFN